MNIKPLFSILILSLFVVSLHAQQFSIGPAVSYNCTWVDGNDVNRSDTYNGWGAGVKFTYSDIQHWGVSGAFGYSQEGFTNKVEGVKSSTTLHYMRVPIQANYYFGGLEDNFRPKIFAGPTLGFLGKATTEIGSVKRDVTDSFQPFDFGLSVGTGFNCRIAEATWFNFDVTYNHGLTQIVQNGGDAKNRSLSVGAGVAFGF